MTASSFAAMLSRRALQLAGFLLLALPVALGQPPPPPGFGFGSGFTSSFTNPILPGFHPDPSCVFISEWADGPTFFCATSSFNAFPGIPIHASRDLRNWKLVGHVLNRPEQLPRLAETNRSTSGIWAPTLRYHNKTFWVVTTLVDDHLPQADSSRWDNIIFKGTDPYEPESWSNAVHFNFTGYDPEPFWDDDGKVYITAAHAWQVGPAIMQAEANLETGQVGEWKTIWEGTGGLAPEGPHIYKKDGYYYLLAAEGGTGLNHMVTIARSKNISGPYESNPANPILSNANTTSYFQTVGHADFFQDANKNWWLVALSTRSGPEYKNYPMGRETVLSPVTWREGEWPTASPIRGEMTGWSMPPATRNIRGVGHYVDDNDTIDFQSTGDGILPLHFTYWRFPGSTTTFSIGSLPFGRSGSTQRRVPGVLRIEPSTLNLTALNGNYAGPAGQAFVGRRQSHTLFSFRVDLDFTPTQRDEEAGVSAFLTQNHHLDMGVVLLNASEATGTFPWVNSTIPMGNATAGPDDLVPMVRFRGISYVPVPSPVILPLPPQWRRQRLTLEIRAPNTTHYVFAIGPADSRSDVVDIIAVDNTPVSWGFTGVLLGVYATTNGGEGGDGAGGAVSWWSRWRYDGWAQLRD